MKMMVIDENVVYPFSNCRLKNSLALISYTSVLSNGSTIRGLCLLVLSAASSLDAFSSYQRRAWLLGNAL